MLLRVAPATLRALSRRLGEATLVAADIQDQRTALHGLLDDPGDEAVGRAARRFVDEWSHGVSCFAADAGLLSDRLLQAGEVYVDVDEAVLDSVATLGPEPGR